MSWQSDLEDDLDWRFAELAALKLQVAAVPQKSITQQALLRALVAMGYAHYEGFCKEAIRLYLDEIKKAGVKREECMENLAIFSLQKIFREAKSMSTNDCWKFYSNGLKQRLEEIVDYELDDKSGEIVLKGDSNLYPNLLKSTLESVCLPSTEVDNNTILLKTLVGRRNVIAHGRKQVINDLAEYQPFEDAAGAVMYELAIEIVDALETKRYLKPLPVTDVDW